MAVRPSPAAKTSKAMLRLSLLLALLGTVRATEGNDFVVVKALLNVSDSGVHVDDDAGWTLCGGGVLALELLAGVLWWTRHRGHTSCVAVVAVFVHGPAQFLPLIVGALMPGWVDCGTGLWWPVHWLYFGVLMIAMPFLTNLHCDTHLNASIPLLSWKFPEGSSAAQAYFFFTSMLTCSDQYLDSMAAAIALQCGWRLAWVMVSVIFVSLCLQALAAVIATKSVGDEAAPLKTVFAVLSGMALPEVKLASPLLKQFAASQPVVKLVTENVPQAILTIMFANEVKPSKMVWFSAAVSLALALKAFISGLSYLLQGEEGAEFLSDEEGEENSEDEAGEEYE